eukprot:gene26381-biopygen16199
MKALIAFGVRDRNRAKIEADRAKFPSIPIPREARDQQLRIQLDSGHEHPPCDMSSSQTGHCYRIDERLVSSGVKWRFILFISAGLEEEF